MKTKLEYSGGAVISVYLPSGTIHKINPGDIVKRGDIPNDAFDGLSVRPDFGATLDEYRASRVRGALPRPVEPKPVEPKPTPKNKKPAPEPALAPVKE